MPTVLVVEDERDIRELLRRYLERAGFTVLTTGSGAEALELLQREAADLLLLDLGLPDVEGTEILAELRRGRHTPVVVLTARSDVEDRIKGLELGADDYVTKPFSPREVVLRVQAVLQRTAGDRRRRPGHLRRRSAAHRRVAAPGGARRPGRST